MTYAQKINRLYRREAGLALASLSILAGLWLLAMVKLFTI